jgi:Fe-Mn family superoxide dismutase
MNDGSRFYLPALPYPAADLAPQIGEETVALHHGVIFQGHVDALNILLDGMPRLRQLPLYTLLTATRLPRQISADVLWHGGAMLLHELYFASMRRFCAGYPMPAGEIIARLKQNIGSYEEFCYRFREAALTLRGNGFVFLVRERSGAGLSITATHEYDLPDLVHYEPIFCIDLWEHAYYGDYRADRRAATSAFLSLLDWSGREKLILNT